MHMLCCDILSPYLSTVAINSRFGIRLGILLFQLASESQLLTIRTQHQSGRTTEGVVGCKDGLQLRPISTDQAAPPLRHVVALLIEARHHCLQSVRLL